VRVVFDTNVIVAGIVAEGLCRELVEVDLPQHEAILSPALWDELVGALREKFGLDAAELPVLQLYHRHATWVDPQPLESPVCRDPDDDWVLATAATGQAELIVSGDEDLLVLGRFRDIAILSPRGFLEHLAR
jgi:putative PIN family toxin of toxin-antitoxin system